MIPKITDFGLAKRVQGGSDLTATGQVLGTPSYMPPEQAAGKLTQIGPASDVYSLGAVLYCLLTGRPPFQSANPVDTLLQVLEQEPISPRQFNPDVPRDLETIALKCLEKNPVRRYVSAESLADDLRRWLNHEPIQARPSTAWERSLKWAKRRPAVASLSLFLVVSLLTGSVVSTLFGLAANRERTKAVQLSDANATLAEKEMSAREKAVLNAERERKERERADEETRRAQRLLYAAKMNLTQAAWENNQVRRLRELLTETKSQPGQHNLCGFEWHYWDRLAHSYQMSFEGHTGKVTSVAFSADGKRLASASWDQTLKVWDAASGQETLTLKGHAGGPVMSVAFSADRNQLASASWDRTVKVWDARPWTPELRAEREALSLIHWLRDQGQAPTEWLDAIAADQTISEPVRQRALQFAREWKPSRP